MIELPMAPRPNPLGESLDQAEASLGQHLLGNSDESVRKNWERIQKQNERREQKRRVFLARSQWCGEHWQKVKAVCERHVRNLDLVPLLARQILFHMSEEWMDDQRRERQMIAAAVVVADEMAEAAMQNEWVKQDIADGVTTEAAVRSNPPVRLEFEQAYVISGLSDCVAAAKNKTSWGKCIGVNPVNPDDYMYPRNVSIYFRDNSTYNRRFKQRKWMKKVLGTGYRSLVGKAMGESKTRFLERANAGDYGPNAAAVVQQKLGVDLGTFWRLVKGAQFMEEPQMMMSGRRKVRVSADQLWLPFEDDEKGGA